MGGGGSHFFTHLISGRFEKNMNYDIPKELNNVEFSSQRIQISITIDQVKNPIINLPCEDDLILNNTYNHMSSDIRDDFWFRVPIHHH